VGSKKIPAESVRLAECVGDVRALLRQILSDCVPSIHVTRKTSKNRSLKSEYFNFVCLFRCMWNMSDTNLFAIFCALCVQFISVL
jgi:hypothetical protein